MFIGNVLSNYYLLGLQGLVPHFIDIWYTYLYGLNPHQTPLWDVVRVILPGIFLFTSQGIGNNVQSQGAFLNISSNICHILTSPGLLTLNIFFLNNIVKYPILGGVRGLLVQSARPFCHLSGCMVNLEVSPVRNINVYIYIYIMYVYIYI